MAAKEVTQKPMSLKINYSILAMLEEFCKRENRKKKEVINSAVEEYILQRSV